MKINAEGDVRIHYVTSTNKEILFINRFFFKDWHQMRSIEERLKTIDNFRVLVIGSLRSAHIHTHERY